MIVAFPRLVGPVLLDVVVSESFTAEMEIPTQPVEKGAKVSDHAWRLPDTLKIEFLHGDMTSTLQALRGLAAEAEPFDILSGFDLHRSMMLQGIEAHRDVYWSDVLSGTLSFKEVIIVGSAEGPAQGNAGTGGDERGRALANRGQVQARAVDTSSGRAAVLARGLR